MTKIMWGPDRINLAIIGCGTVAAYGHIPAISKLHGVRCVACVDIHRSRAEQAARVLEGADVYDDYREVLHRSDVDAVAVLSKPTTHCRMVVDALELGKDVFVEKPISATVAEAERMIAVARNTGRKLFVGHLLCFTPAYRTMGDVIRSGIIGSPVVYRMSCFENYAAGDEFSWKRAISFMTDTSPAFDCGVHYVDLMRWFSGAEAVEVHGIGARVHPDVPEGCFDWESLQVSFQDGSRGIYEAGWGFSFPENRMVREAIGPKGRVEVRLDHAEEGREAGATTVLHLVGSRERIIERSGWKGFEEEWKYFVRMLREDIDPFPLLNDSLAALRIVDEGHRSALTRFSTEKVERIDIREVVASNVRNP